MAAKKVKRVTAKSIFSTLNNIYERCRKDKDDASVYAKSLDAMLDELAESDFFGTEGQLDPRGDGRM